MEQDEKENLQKKGRLCYRPVVDEHGNFGTSDNVQYETKGGVIHRVGNKEAKRLEKKEKKKARKRRKVVMTDPALRQQKCLDCLTSIDVTESWAHEGIGPLCKSCFDIRNGAEL